MNKLKKIFNMHNVVVSVVFLLVVIILVILIMGGCLYYFCYNTIYSEFLQGNQQRITAVANRHENDVRITEDIVTQLSLSEDIIKFRLDSDAQKAIELQERLKQYTYISQFFSTMLYQYHNDKYLFNDSTSIETQFFLVKGCGLEKEEAEKMEELLFSKSSKFRIMPEQRSNSWWMYNYIQDYNQIFFFHSIPPGNDQTLVFVVPGTYYDELLGNMTEEQYSCFLYYDGQIILKRGNIEVSTEDLEELCFQESVLELGNKENLEIGQKNVQIGGEKYLLSILKGSSGIFYGTLQPMIVFHGKIMTGQMTIILLFAFCLLVTVSVVVLFSGKIVTWFKRVSILLDEEETYDLIGVEEGIRSLITADKESQRERHLQKRSMFVRNFIRGDYGDRQAVIEAGKEAGLRLDYQRFIVVVLRNKEENNEIKVFSVIQEMLSKETQVDGYGVHLISNNQNVFVLFGETEDAIEIVLQRFLEIEKRYSKDYIIAVSNFHNDFGESSRAYLEADMAFDNHLLLDNNRILRFAEILHKEHKSFSAESYLRQLRYAIQNRDMEAAEAAVNGICSKFKYAEASLYTFRIFYLDVIHILLSEWGEDEIQLDRFFNVFTLSQCMNIQDFYDLLCEICKAIIDKNSGKELQEHDIVQEAISYMKENFQMPDLTMNALADHLGISSVVLAVEFRNVMDIKPSDYLGNLRMEKSKELLNSTKMLVGEISRAVGYEDPHVFMRRFKKYTGMTPKQYRMEHMTE